MSNKKNQFKKRKNFYSETISFEDNSLFSSVCGELDNNLKFIEKEIGVEIIPRGNILTLNGSLLPARRNASLQVSSSMPDASKIIVPGFTKKT